MFGTVFRGSYDGTWLVSLLETKMAVSLMEHARPEDKIALFLIGVDIPAGSFLAASEVRARLQALASSRPKAKESMTHSITRLKVK